MRNRDKLISLAIKYQGDYNLIKKAIINKEVVNELSTNNCLTIFDDEYPIELFNLESPPFVLFYKGDITLLKERKIGIVGSRAASDYALRATAKFVEKVKNENVIVSGLARGVDACAHKHALKTIGVLGCGIDYVYPKENVDLYKSIIKNGLLISEYPDMTIPKGYHFPFRNRIIAALSKEIIVMEAQNKSGTLTTINEALTLGKEVKVLPFSVFDEDGKFNNHLIQEGAGILKYEDLN